MTVTATPRILPSEMSKYPGMRPREGQVFRIWARIHQSEYDYFSFNVRVGPGRPLQGDFPDHTKQTALLSSQQRLDAVGWQRGTPVLIEVKDFATVTAIGQVLEYAALWAATFPEEKPARLLIVCNNYEQGFGERAAAAGVAVQLVPTQ